MGVELRHWRVIFRGRLTNEMAARLEASGILRSGPSTLSGAFDRGARELYDHPLRVAAGNADEAFVKVTQVLGDGYTANIVATPTLLAE